ncbi:class I SAM-dependent methyltransferase [Nocardioides silvaticus]|uniref:Class I SAM-dependent methyltransferase n=1 Tax=Nocardioides silvaticus TaxID=2201891 RepID=A0A316THU2_9ACTN|nr:class I SAM-dependent methyltransferase [Nocardioides silvaticus]
MPAAPPGRRRPGAGLRRAPGDAAVGGTPGVGRGVTVQLSRIPGLGGWDDDPLWAHFYDWSVEHRRLGGLAWRLGIQSDLGKLYAAAAEIGRQPAGSRVLDIPCGGGVALRGLKPGQGVEYVAADIAQTMLDRTVRAAERRGVADQVEPRIADVGDLPIDDGTFDLVVSFTGLHCFPDPQRAVVEMVRVLEPGGVLTGSALLNDSGLHHEPLRRIGRAAGLLGPGCTGEELVRWLESQRMADVVLDRSGAIGYFRAVKRG